MKLVILDGDSIGGDISIERLKQLGDVSIYGQTQYTQIAERVRDADIIIANKSLMREETLKEATHVQMIAVTATGVNNVDLDYAKERGIAVTNVAGYSTDSVVQHTFAMLFYVWEKLAYYDSYVKSGEYTRCPIFCHMGKSFYELKGKTFGIIGLGAIGTGVARAAQAFGCHVIYYSSSGNHRSDEFEQVDFDTLLARSDVVSIHAPLNARTENLMTADAFRKMKPSAILINAGRGPIVNEADLAQALKDNEIAGAALDVLTEEPMRPDNPLLSVKDSGKLLITPHIAWATVEARQRLVEEVCLNIEAFLKGEERNRV